MRRALLDAGHDPTEVEAALQEWQLEQAAGAPDEQQQRTYRRWTIALHLGALVAVFVVVLLLNGLGSSAVPNALIAAVVLGLFLALGWAVSFLIGRTLLPQTGMAVALIVPLVSAVGLGGTCVSIMSGFPIGRPPPPSWTGVAKLHIEPPLSFDGSGVATCFGDARSGFGVRAENVGTLDGAFVSVSVDPVQPARPRARQA